MSDLEEFGTWMGGATGPYYNPKKNYEDPKILKEIIKDFMSRIENMEEFLMTEAYSSIIEDKHYRLYPITEVEELAVRDLIEYYTELEEYEKCARIVKYLEDGKQYHLTKKD
tara:strand:+ start:158 stop:493 length:336 start_codon:yes stop_codon:yes gene_type:complete